MYNHANQYRCTIIRGKSKKEMDNLLPLYAKIISSICPCDASKFAKEFNIALRPAMPASTTEKTINNHRTEIAEKLFGMYYMSDDGTVYTSERTLKFLSDSDTPAFFKDICYKMQFPNGSQKYNTLRDRREKHINIRQFPFVLKVMLLLVSKEIALTKKEIGYYMLNSLDVLQGKATPLEVYDQILADHQNGIVRELGSGSHDTQHINEQINLLELANLVIVNNDKVYLNQLEMTVVEIFAGNYAKKPEFDIYKYDLEIPEVRKQFFLDWNYYYSKLSDKASKFETSLEALGLTSIPAPTSEGLMCGHADTIAIGDEGERYVFEFEKRRVSEFNIRLAGKVLHLGKTRGLGYDIQSVVAVPGDNAEYVKYIEVKATKRVTAPEINNNSWIDTINITRNEWVAAQQHRGYYSIFRVYFIRAAIVMFLLTDIASKHDNGTITAVPTTYRIDFGRDAIDQVISSPGGFDANA